MLLKDFISYCFRWNLVYILHLHLILNQPHFHMLNSICLEKAMTLHSSTLAWKFPWMEEPGGLQSMRSLRVGHDWATSLFTFHFSCVGEGNGNPLQCSCLENPRDGGAWWAAVYGVAHSWTQLKQLCSSNYCLIQYSSTLLQELPSSFMAFIACL